MARVLTVGGHLVYSDFHPSWAQRGWTRTFRDAAGALQNLSVNGQSIDLGLPRIVEEDLLKESYVEHDAAKLLIAEIEAANGADDEYFDAKVKVLQEEIEHHVEEEEQAGGVFSQARKGKIDLDSLGDQLAARKKELTASYKASGVPQPELTTMDEVSV